MDKKKALFHAVITALTVCLVAFIIVGIVSLLCFVLRDYPLLIAAALIFVVLALIVGISSYKFYRKED